VKYTVEELVAIYRSAGPLERGSTLWMQSHIMDYLDTAEDYQKFLEGIDAHL
jgi:hypothetical protein